eukprot:288928-Lingulodinium_polyedra.AAC.1
MRKHSKASWNISGASTNPYMAQRQRRTHSARWWSGTLNSCRASGILRQWRHQFSGGSTQTILGSLAS